MPMTFAKAVRLQLLVENVRNSPHEVLQYNRDADKLLAWAWPSSDGIRVTPSALQDYRQSHRILGPCCLCPLMDANQPDFLEAAIYVVSAGPLSGKYVAGCAQDRCGYFVHMEKLYTSLGLTIKGYPRRGTNERVPPQVTHISENDPLVVRSRALKRTFAMLDINEAIFSTSKRRAPTGHVSRSTVSELLQKLDARIRPGITQAEFKRMVVMCECGLITTRRAFNDHDCRNEVIDLTGDD